MFRFIRKSLTFDQFITRLICECRNVKFYCQKDLVERGVDPKYFEKNDEIKKFLLAAHKAKSIEDIPPDDITFNCGMKKDMSEFIIDPEFKHMNEVQITKFMRDDKKVNQWKASKKCLKSNFTIIPKHVKKKTADRIQELDTHANRLKFCKTTTFRLDVPLNPNDNRALLKK